MRDEFDLLLGMVSGGNGGHRKGVWSRPRAAVAVDGRKGAKVAEAAGGTAVAKAAMASGGRAVAEVAVEADGRAEAKTAAATLRSGRTGAVARTVTGTEMWAGGDMRSLGGCSLANVSGKNGSGVMRTPTRQTQSRNGSRATRDAKGAEHAWNGSKQIMK